MNNELRIQEIIQKRGIIKLIHVTRKKNLKSIYEHGILPRKKLDEKKIEYVFNDNKTDTETTSKSNKSSILSLFIILFRKVLAKIYFLEKY